VQILDLVSIVHAHLVPRMDHAPVAERQADVTPGAMCAVDGTTTLIEDERASRGRRGRVVLLGAVPFGGRGSTIAAEDLDLVRTLVRILHERETAQRIASLAYPAQGPRDGGRRVVAGRSSLGADGATPLR
jgi:hypothetical protein